MQVQAALVNFSLYLQIWLVLYQVVYNGVLASFYFYYMGLYAFWYRGWTILLLSAYVVTLCKWSYEMRPSWQHRTAGQSLAVTQAIKCVLFATTLISSSYPMHFHTWLWSSRSRHVAFTSLALCSSCINAAYGIVYMRRRHLSCDEEQIRLLGDSMLLVVSQPQSDENITSESLLSPRVVAWIHDSRLISANGSIDWCQRRCSKLLRAAFIAPKWLLGSLSLSLISLVENTESLDGGDSSNADRGSYAPYHETGFGDFFYAKPPPLLEFPYCDEHEPSDASSSSGQNDTPGREGIDSSSTPPEVHATRNLLALTPLRPRYLCMLRYNGSGSVDGYEVQSTEGKHVEFVFVSYTTAHFRTTPLRPEQDDPALDAAMSDDRVRLTDLAIIAAKSSGVKAFWIDFECVKEESPNGFKEDVYRICDVLRASHCMALVVGPNRDEGGGCESQLTKEEWLIEWGKRLWTIPEALLCPTQHDIKIIAFGSDGSPETELVAKRNLATRIWNDPDLMSLVEHYESSLQLTPLELFSTLLPRMLERSKNQRLRADAIYALQGLLRQRLKAHEDDTEFSAFANLCLANDSRELLERILCLQPMNAHALWHELHDIQGTSLWNIRPTIQVAKVLDGSTLKIGSARLALINWRNLAPVRIQLDVDENFESSRAIHLSNLPLGFMQIYILEFLFFQCNLVFLEDMKFVELPDDFMRWLATILTTLVAIAFVFSLLSPFIWRRWSKSNIKSAQARFFGIKGTPDLAKVESALTGWNRGKLKWGEEQRAHASHGPAGSHVYTLVDTVTMKATQFRAARVPTVVMGVGEAEGKLRAMLCSYDLQKCAFARETVLQMEVQAMDRMHRVDHVRLSVYSD